MSQKKARQELPGEPEISQKITLEHRDFYRVRPAESSEFLFTGTLHCPACGGEYLHHGNVEKYDRPEDGETTRRTTLGERISMVFEPSTRSRNPSARRDGVVIEFSCEDCGETNELAISQHKGQTFVVWRAPPVRAAR